MNFTFWPFVVFEHLKKYHWVFPFVLMSFCRTRSYSFSETLIAESKLPDSNLDSKTSVLSSGPVGL